MLNEFGADHELQEFYREFFVRGASSAFAAAGFSNPVYPQLRGSHIPLFHSALSGWFFLG